MPYKILITPAAVTDIEAAIAYYNEQATDLVLVMKWIWINI